MLRIDDDINRASRRVLARALRRFASRFPGLPMEVARDLDGTWCSFWPDGSVHVLPMVTAWPWARCAPDVSLLVFPTGHVQVRRDHPGQE